MSKPYLQLSLAHLAASAPHLVERFTRTAKNAEQAGECQTVKIGLTGDVVVFDCRHTEDTAPQLFDAWHDAGVPKAAMKLLGQVPENRSNEPFHD